jgi:hypothetical protein
VTEAKETGRRRTVVELALLELLALLEALLEVLDGEDPDTLCTGREAGNKRRGGKEARKVSKGGEKG